MEPFDVFRIDQQTLLFVKDDYQSFIETFKEEYRTDAYSIQWCESLELSTSQPHDRLDRFKLVVFKNRAAYDLSSNLQIYPHFTAHPGQGITVKFVASIKFTILSPGGEFMTEYTFGGLHGKKITDDSMYEDIDTPGCNSTALSTGNSYLEHYLIMEFLEDEFFRNVLGIEHN
jgi:hypothetical protein